MKKSEAIKLIEEVIYDTYEYDPDQGWTVDAEAVLDALLKEGMLPPKYTKILDDSGVKKPSEVTFSECPVLGKYATGYTMPNYTDVSEWEPENEA